MGFSGSLESINLADIFQNLAMNHQTGTLNISDRDRTKCIYFEKGEVRYLSHGKRKNILLGEMLVGRGLATRTQVDTALAEQRASSSLLGEVIVSLGIISRKDIDDLVRFQIEEEIYDLFGWEHARFEFVEGAPQSGLFDPEQQATELAIDTSHLILEAARRIDEWERIRSILPSMTEVFTSTVAALPETATPVAQRIFAYLDGSRDVTAVADDSHFSRFEVASSIVAMLEGGHIRPATAEELMGASNECSTREQPELAARLMETALSRRPNDLSIREGLAEALLVIDEKEKAAIHLGVIGEELSRQGDEEGAGVVCERILTVLPKHIGAQEKLARLSASKGEKAKAVLHFAGLSRALVEAGRLDEATVACREGLAIDAGNAEIRSALATVLITSGDKDGAVLELESLGEFFARAGQTRPAAEAFRRILQIDPRNRHARNRLSSVLAGKGMGKQSHAVRNIIAFVLLAVLGGGVYVVMHELKLQNDIDEAVKECEACLAKDDFDGARAVMEPFLKEWSVLGTGKEARGHLEQIEQRRSRYEVGLCRELGRRAAEIEELHEEAAGGRADYDLDAARKKFGEAVSKAGALLGEGASFLEADTEDHDADIKLIKPPLRWTPEAEERLADLAERVGRLPEESSVSGRDLTEDDYLRLKEKLLRVVKVGSDARSSIEGIEKEEEAIRGFLRWKKGAETRSEVASIEEELRRTRAICREYPGNPKLAKVTRPLLVLTEPRGARVFVNDELRGTASREGLVVRIPVSGSHMIRAERTGYSVIPQIAPRDRTQLKLSLARKWAWRFESEAKVLSLAAGPRGLVLVGNRDGMLAAIDPSTPVTSGDTKDAAWSLGAGDRGAGITSGIAVFGDAIYVGSDSLSALDVKDRAVPRWAAPVSVGGRIRGRPTTGNVELLRKDLVFGTCVEGGRTGCVWAVDVSSGEPVHWSPARPAGGMVSTNARAFYREKTLYVPFNNGRIYALQAADGKAVGRWRTGTTGRLTSIAWDGRAAWVGTGTGKLCRVDLDTSDSPVRGFEVARAGLTDLVVRDGIAYFGDEGGYLHAFSLSREAPVWAPFKGQGGVMMPPAVSEKRVYFATSSGWVYAVDRATGKLVDEREEPTGWKFPLEQDISGGVLFDGRYLYAGGSDGYVYAFDEQGNP
jgi:outer membrane protein assembly factor BamB/tetratricopeptide (TPR) repeat protein